MRRRIGTSRFVQFVAAGVIGLVLCSRASAEVVTRTDLQAVANALGFLDGLPSGGTPINVAVVYSDDNADAKTEAAQVAAEFGELEGPNRSPLHAIALNAKDMAQSTIHLNAMLILPSALSHAAAIADTARRRHLVTISTDPSCMVQKCCVLMVHTAGRVRIVLDTAMADSVGASFSSVFEMMVERK